MRLLNRLDRHADRIHWRSSGWVSTQSSERGLGFGHECVIIVSMENVSLPPMLELRTRIKSLNKSRPTPKLIELIQDSQDELLGVLADADKTLGVETVSVERDEAFGTGLELLGILFLVGLGRGLIEGVGEGLGKEAGKKVGTIVFHWVEKKFGDVEFGDVEIVTLDLSKPNQS